jgi:hypothetical protein
VTIDLGQYPESCVVLQAINERLFELSTLIIGLEWIAPASPLERQHALTPPRASSGMLPKTDLAGPFLQDQWVEWAR